MDYSHLAKVLRERAEKIFESGTTPADDPTNAELLQVLARILEGKPIERAFGAPGDWGYSTPIGKALFNAYRG